ncbi:MAG: ParB/RepB/Spo0J family partition protein [Candidatus Paceibacterota bacterium]|jgi:ParB family chromosome partitioning protein
MDSNPSLGQGLNALIPPKKLYPELTVEGKSRTGQNASQLEERINHKVNESVSHFPSDLIAQKPLENLREDFKADFKAETTPEKTKGQSFQEILPQEKPKLVEEKVFQIETEKIKPNPYQPRHIFTEDSLRELAGSIREFGILQPLIATRIEKETEKGTEVEYQLIAGERRLMASKMIGLPTVPVIIRRPLEDQKKLEIALIENIQREDLGVVSKAKAFERLMNEFGLTQQELAGRLGKSREVIANTLRLLQLPLEIQKAIEEGLINEGHARAILLLNNPEKRKLFFKEILSKNLSGREAMDLAQRYLQLEGKTNNFSQKRRQNLSVDPQDLEWKEKLEEYFQMPVFIKKKGERGAIEIKFFTEKDFDTILKKLFSS